MINPGDKVIIKLRSKINPRTGEPELRPARAVIQTVQHVFPHNRVRTTVGDVWKVEHYDGEEVKFQAVE